VLPDGIAHEDLTALLPALGLGAAAVLRHSGLAFDEGPRLRTLAPIREHVAITHPPRPADRSLAIHHYAELAATTGYQVGYAQGAEAAVRVQSDVANITAALEWCAADGNLGQLADGISGMAEFWRFTGIIQPRLIDTARQAMASGGSPSQQAKTWEALGYLTLDRSDHDGALDYYKRAMPLYQQVGSVLGEANCIQGLGDIARACSDHDTARSHYEKALLLFQRIKEPYSVGNTLLRLARIAPDTDDRDRCWKAAREAWASIGRDDLIASYRGEFE
jgi:tetratricopeptide (TPR) repeat protein